MKCQLCDGKGEYMHQCGGYRPCEHCNGTGKIVQTNEEWFCGLNTEEKADFFCTVQHCLTIYGDHIATIEDWEKWLKEKHE